MDVKLFNTISRSIEKIEPISDNEVRMYHCGPTVYDFAHIGNLRAFIVNDTLRRTFEYLGYNVKQVMNITDVDDKMIARAKQEGVTIQALAREYTNFLLADFKALNILTPHKIPHATEHIGGMIVMIEKLLREGYAYTTSDGVYFEVSKSKNYGALAQLDLGANTESRIENINDKKSHRDFALWKFESADDNGVAYDASFGRGRPGWHIECSEMACDSLGETVDIHTGGVDLIFPHHTNEIAQSEAVNAKTFVHTWVHIEFVMIDGQKMSKSLGNHTTLKTVTERGFSPLSFRYFVLGTHYRSKLNFTWEALDGAQNALKRLNESIRELPDGGTPVPTELANFENALCNDMHVTWALARIWQILKEEPDISPADKKATILEFDRVLGLGLENIKKETIPSNIVALTKAREEARKSKNWAKSDKIRDEINSFGWSVEDTDKGPKIIRLDIQE